MSNINDPEKDAIVDVIQKVDQEKKEKSAGFGDYIRIFTFADRWDVILLVVAAFAAVAAGASLALVNIVFGGFVTAVTDFTLNGPSEYFSEQVNQYSLYFVYLAIGRFCLTYIYTVCSNVASTRITRNIRYEYLKSTLSQSVAYFDEGSRGSVVAEVTASGNMIHQGTAEKLGLTVQAISAFVAAFVVAFVAQWKLTLITICIIPFTIIAVGITATMDAKLESGMLDIYSRAGSFAEEVIASMRTVQAFWAGPQLVNKYDGFLREARVLGRKKSPVYAVMFSSEFFAVYAGFALAFWQGIHMFNRGEIDSSGTVITVLFSMVVAATSMSQTAPNIVSVTNAASAAASLFKTIDHESEINSLVTSGKMPDTVVGALQLSHVNFAYPTRPGVPVLTDFTLQIPAGKVTALVGASGSGKSTIVGLIERWYNLNSGTIDLDGTSIDKLNLKSLRTHVRLVQQEPVLFMGTVFENVRYGLIGTQWEDSPMEDQRKLVEDACKLAYAHDFVSDLPKGYDTECGERAGLLSGGQKQRIAIARSIIAQPKVLLLDEATSALDPHAEGIVQKALDNAAKNRTTVVIAHKLGTIKNADNIVVMSKGQIVEQGTHDSLLEVDGAYAKLVKIQDLGQGNEKQDESRDIDNEHSREHNLELSRTMTRFSTNKIERMQQQQDRDDYDIHKPIGLVTVVFKLLSEQKDLSWCYILTIFACLIGGVTYPAQAVLFSRIMDVFVLPPDQRLEQGNFYALMFFVVALGQVVAYGIIGWTSNTIVQAIMQSYRRQFFQSILKQDMQFFDRSENTAGALTSRLSSEPQALTELMGFNLMLIFISVVNLAASCTLALVYGWKLSLVVIFGGLPPLVASGLIRMRIDLKMNEDNNKRYSDSAALAGEAVAAIRTVSSLTLEPTVLQRYNDKLKYIVHISILKTMHMMIWFSMTQCIEFLFLALAFWYGCQLLSRGEYTMAQFYVVFIGVFYSGQAASAFFSYSTSITKGKSAANYIFWIRALQPTIGETDSNHNNGPPDTKQHDIGLNDLRFSYPLRPDAQVLRGVSLKVHPGQFVALVGASGCGKSTLVAMLERFYDPVTGTITLSSADISHLSPRLYRRAIALVQQEPTLYQGSIRENIALGIEQSSSDISSPPPTEEQITHAARLANAWTFISSLPSGLDTACGSRGLSLSGGQRQRIAIARALIRNPNILLLDEATSALDTESEKIVQAALAHAARDGERRITVAVAHRLSTVRDADVICVFHDGKIVEMGTHTELLGTGGLYRRMCEAQSLDRAV